MVFFHIFIKLLRDSSKFFFSFSYLIENMSFINDNVLIKYHSDLVINWDSSSKEQYIAKKELLYQYQEMILEFYHNKQKYYYYDRGIFYRFLHQYYFILYQFSNNRCWFDFKDVTYADNYLKHGQKIKKISEIPWSKIFLSLIHI